VLLLLDVVNWDGRIDIIQLLNGFAGYFLRIPMKHLISALMLGMIQFILDSAWR
jgi:hypothetical protein